MWESPLGDYAVRLVYACQRFCDWDCFTWIDWRAAFSSIFLASSFFYISNIVHARSAAC